MTKTLNRLVLAFVSMLWLAACAWAVPTDITVKSPVDLTGTLAADAADFTWTAADVANGNSCDHTGRELILVNNTGASPYTVTVTSVADELGRTGDKPSAYSMAAGDYSVFGPYPVRGWRQSTGKLHFSASNAAVKFVIIRLPSF